MIPPVAINALLPLFCLDSAHHSVAMIRHSMAIVKAALQHVNHGQVPVLAADQPLFALAKDIQWTWPATHGEDQFVIMFGGLHIEMGVLMVRSMIYSNSQCCIREIPVHVVVRATLFHQCSVQVHLATEIAGLMCQSEASVVQSEHHLHNLRFVSAAWRLSGGQRLDERPSTSQHCQLWVRHCVFIRWKNTACEIWKVFPEVNGAFVELLRMPSDVREESMSLLERFVVLMYDRTSVMMEVNGAMEQLFAHTSRALDNIPPTQAALQQLIKRASLQANCWNRTLVLNPELPSPSDWGWTKEASGWQPLWTTLPEASKSCHELQEGVYRPLQVHQGCTQVHCIMCMLGSLGRLRLCYA